MSNRYKGGVISATPPTLVAGAGASGAWTLEQQMQAIAAGLWPVNGPFYIEDVFSTYLYTGTSASNTITNSIDLAGNGGMVWIKGRDQATSHVVVDSVRGGTKRLTTNSTAASTTNNVVTSFNSNGFTLGTGFETDWNQVSPLTAYASWTFREQPKFFDVVTYTGDGTSNKSIAHSLGSVPGCVIIKLTSSAGSSWQVWHRGSDSQFSSGGITGLQLDLTDAGYTTYNYGDSLNIMAAQPTSTNIYVKNPSFDASACNASGSSYVAYIFAHNAGGFGLTGTDNVISCGSYTGNGSATGPVVTLGYEPQWVMVKNASAAGEWLMFDVMRSMSETGSRYLEAQSSAAEGNVGSASVVPTATGFRLAVDGGFTSLNASGNTYIYIAIRRGPMKVPTDATKVFAPVAYTGTNVDNRLVDTGILTDMTMARIRATTSTGGFYAADRLRGNASLATALTDVENTDADSFMTPTVGYGGPFSAMNGFGVGNDVTRQLNQSSTTQLAYAFQRAPSFFDEVCYTGTGAGQVVSHNLGVVPELAITKCRGTAATNWVVCSAYAGTLNLNSTSAQSGTAWSFNGTNPTSTEFTTRGASNSEVNSSGSTFCLYLFATCAGVSKVGSYTGTGSTQTISCGFTGGARFVLVKRTDSTGDWYVWDTARGMVSGTDPSLLLNSTAAEVNANSIYTTTGGFQIVSTAAGINASGGTYIYLAIA